MSDIVLANESKADTLDELVPLLNTLHIRLWVAVTGGVLDPDYDASDFTEPTDTGYGYEVAVFGSSVLNGSDEGETTAPTLTWTFDYSGGTPFTVKGWYAENPATGRLWGSAFGSADVVISGVGQTYTLDPEVLLDTLT